MGLFNFLRNTPQPEKSWEEADAYHGETPPCPRCGAALTKRFVYSDMYCSACNYGLDDDDTGDESETLSVSDAAQIWASNGKDEDYTFGYSEEELEAEL